MPIRIDRSFAYTVRLLLLVLTFIQICIGVALLIVSEYYKRTLLQHLPVTELSIEMHVFCIQFYGVHIIVHYLFGFPLVRQCARATSPKEMHLLHRMWHVFVVLVSLDGLLVWWMWSRSEIGLTGTVEEVMLRGVDQYYVDPAWRLLWDEYQMGDQCCGVHGYRDWIKTEWQEVQDDDETMQIDGGVLEQRTVSSLPYSCCKSNSDCYVDRIPSRIRTWTEQQDIDLSSINLNGCLEVFANNFNAYSMVLKGTVIAVIVLQVIILLGMRYLRIFSQIVPQSNAEKFCQTDIPTGKPLDQSFIESNHSTPPSPESLFKDSIRMIYETETSEPRKPTVSNADQPVDESELQEIMMQKRIDRDYYKVNGTPRNSRGSKRQSDDKDNGTPRNSRDSKRQSDYKDNGTPRNSRGSKRQSDIEEDDDRTPLLDT